MSARGLPTTQAHFRLSRIWAPEPGWPQDLAEGRLRSQDHVPAPPLTQLGALLRGDRLITVGLAGHGACDAALAPALAVGSFSALGGHGFPLIVVLPGGVVRLLPESQRGMEMRSPIQDSAVGGRGPSLLLWGLPLLPTQQEEEGRAGEGRPVTPQAGPLET